MFAILFGLSMDYAHTLLADGEDRRLLYAAFTREAATPLFS